MKNRLVLAFSLLASLEASGSPTFDESSAQETYLKKLQPSAGDNFGFRLDLSDDFMIVADFSQVTIFERSLEGWTEQDVLDFPNPDPNTLIRDVAISGDTALVGLTNPDVAHVFVRQGSSWNYSATLEHPDQGHPCIDTFGTQVDLDGDLAVSTEFDGSASNCKGDGFAGVFVYERIGSNWEFQINLADLIVPTSSSVINFSAVTVSGNTIIGTSSVDRCYVFERIGSVWTPQGRLEASNFDFGDNFGTSISVDGDTAIVGAPSEDSGSGGVNGDQGNQSFGFNAGAAYVFVRSNNTWTQEAYLKASNPISNGNFGERVAVSGNWIAVGAPHIPSGGRVFLFSRSGNDWVEILSQQTPNPNSMDDTGASVALSASRLAVGSNREDSSATGNNGNSANNTLSDSGAVWTYDFELPPTFYCTGKLSSSGCLAIIRSSDLFCQPVSGAGDYFITASNVEPVKTGLVFASLSGMAALPFNGGTLCVQPPTKRGPIMNSQGELATACSGSFSTLANDGSMIPSGLDAGPGTTAWYQYCYRDPNNGQGSLGSGYSNAIELTFQ